MDSEAMEVKRVSTDLVKFRIWSRRTTEVGKRETCMMLA